MNEYVYTQSSRLFIYGGLFKIVIGYDIRFFLPLQQGDPGPEGDPGLTVRNLNLLFINHLSSMGLVHRATILDLNASCVC